MNHSSLSHRVILALSFASGLAPAARERLTRRSKRALEMLCDAAPRLSHAEADLLVFEAGEEAPRHIADDGAFACSFGVGGTDWRRERACAGAALLDGVRAHGAVAVGDYVPPFAALFRRRREAPVEAATDACGILHAYVTQGSGFAACSSSCLALGALLDDGLDLEALAAYAQLGMYPGTRTPLAGVRRLLPGESCALSAGALRVTTWADAPLREPAFASFDDAVAAGAEALQAALRACSAAHPRLGISLSGGFDSRLALAALAPERRAQLEVFCIDAPGKEDAAIVRQLAAQCGFAPTFVALDAFPREQAVALAIAAARRRDYCANPLSTAVLEWAETTLPNTPRLHGQNGEFLHGHFYWLDAKGGGVTREKVAALMRSSPFIGGTAVSPQVLAPDFRTPIEESLCDEIHAWLLATGLSSHDALDELYLSHRMATWVGVELSRTSMRRIDLSPFFDPRVLAFARRAAPRDKRGSKLAAAVLEAFDPALAALPLEGQRPSPAALWRGDAATINTVAPAVRRGSGGPVGAAAVRAELLRDADTAGLSLARAAALPLFEERALDGALRVDSPLDLVTLGFVLDVEWILAFLEQARSI